MNTDGNSTWMSRANNYISAAELRELGGRAFAAKTTVFPKVGATINTNKKRILATTGVVDNNVMGVTVKDSSVCLPEFLFFWFQEIELARLASPGTVPSITTARVKEQQVMLPTVAEQQQITSLLLLVNRAVERLKRMTVVARELKQALLQKLFTEGTRAERLKKTAIGAMPASWKIEELGALVADTEQVDARRSGNTRIKYVDVSGISREFLRVESSASFRLKDAPGRARKVMKEGDVIFATIRPTLLRVARIPKALDGEICSTAFCVLRDSNEATRGRFIYYAVQRVPFVTQLAAIESGASYPAVTDRQVKAQPVPVPSPAEQLVIAAALEECDAAIICAADRSQLLADLYRTLVHGLISGRMRVRDIDMSVLSEVDQSRAKAG